MPDDNKTFRITKKSLLVGLAIFLGGALALGGVNVFFSHTNELEFCVSCHSMQKNFEEYKETVHYKNASGVRAVCSDCHVPKDFLPKLQAKIVAVKDVYHEIMGTVDSEEKFEARRWNMAMRVWERMKETDSRECRGCHDFENMDFSAQGRMARRKHPRAQMRDKTCIECHRGIAHFEPFPPEGWIPPEEEPDPEDEADAGAEETAQE